MQTLRHIDLAPWHTLRASAQAAQLTLIDDADELKACPPDAFILGGGSNVIFVGEVTRPLWHLNVQGREVVAEDNAHIYYRVAAGETWAKLVEDCAGQGWYGLENLALIPGTVGAAPVQNIGAYGVEVAQVIDSVQVYDRFDNTTKDIRGSDCAFAYRQSHFKGLWQNRYIITAVTFKLAKSGKLVLDYPDLAAQAAALHTPADVCHAVTTVRQRKLPDPAELPNAGSFFHNPLVDANQAVALAKQHPDMPQYPSSDGMVKISAGWCIEQCGFKGQYDGAVGMYEGHALVLVNCGGSGQDILNYAAKVRQAVGARFGLTLHIEPIIVGEHS